MLPGLVASCKREIPIGSVVEELSVQLELSLEERQEAEWRVRFIYERWMRTFSSKASLNKSPMATKFPLLESPGREADRFLHGVVNLGKASTATAFGIQSIV